ncbi:site-specific integrase [Parafilimonas terrae]|uniref:Phage integrase family protein n=1 Tax=Parafilimonas terrae TaxID=1465490 RepID=A0A1I5UAF2_9BACT|nr:site-specific integrase [Parafilimonas terrae]SFP92198.1 Phage integrase family protein [Parafilimonas terrae]
MPRSSSVNYYLDSVDNEGKSLIFLQYVYSGQKLKLFFGQRVKPGNWNKAKQRVKNNKETTADGKFALNNLLDSLAKECERAYNVEMKSGIPAPATLKQYLQNFLYQNHNDDDPDKPTLFSLLERFISGEIKSAGKDKSANTIKTYRTLQGHLLEYQQVKKEKIDFDIVTLDFYYKFVSFLRNRENHKSEILRSRTGANRSKRVADLNDNSISKDIKILKLIMGEAVDLGYTNNLQFKLKKFAVTWKESDAVYLPEKEIIKLYKTKFENKRLEQVRDLFVFGCFVGLRFSDYNDIKPENIVQIDGDYFIKMETKKTKELVIIPCNPVVLDIFNKYRSNHNRLPKSLSNQKFNDYIKEACKLAGMAEKGRLSTSPDLELWQCVSSHTARRSFATNYYLEGFPTIDLMKITGHKTEKAFLKYIRVTKLDTAKRLSQHIKKNWSEKMLRIA